MKPSQELINRAREIQQMATNFCNRHLTDEYARLCEKLITKVLGSPSASVLMSGRSISIAAGIVQVISANNYLFRSNTHPITGEVIAQAFGVSEANLAAKAAQIRKAAKVQPKYDPDYGTPEAKENSYTVKMQVDLKPMFENLQKLIDQSKQI